MSCSTTGRSNTLCAEGNAQEASTDGDNQEWTTAGTVTELNAVQHWTCPEVGKHGLDETFRKSRTEEVLMHAAHRAACMPQAATRGTHPR